MPRGRGKGRGGRGARGRGLGKGFATSATPLDPSASSSCKPNATAHGPKIAALPSYFLRHWPPRSVTFATAQQTYEQQAGWGRTRFQIVGGKLYYPNLKHNTFGCVLRRTPILAWALLETLQRHPSIPDVDISVNCACMPFASPRTLPPCPPPSVGWLPSRRRDHSRRQRQRARSPPPSFSSSSLCCRPRQAWQRHPRAARASARLLVHDGARHVRHPAA